MIVWIDEKHWNDSFGHFRYLHSKGHNLLFAETKNEMIKTKHKLTHLNYFERN